MHTIYVVEDEVNLQVLLEHNLASWGYAVRVFGNGDEFVKALDSAATPQPALALLDIMLPGVNGVEALKRFKQQYPDTPAIMLSGQGRMDVAVETIKLGAYDYLQKPVDLTKLEITVRNAIHTYALANEVKKLAETSVATIKFNNIISASDTMQGVFKLIRKVQNTNISVLIQGETGTGKELIARAIHDNDAKRSSGPFIALNCASIPHELLESELFGHERGSFTGAIQRKIGKFEQAHGGTLFLDEIGELDLSLQAKLLRVLQTRQFERVGGSELIQVDVRIISATHRNIPEAIKQQAFREDLYYRLASFPIKIPPLRERREDIPVLATFFLDRFAERYERSITGGFSRKALKALYDYAWPGNVRELEHTVERAVILCDSDTITEQDLQLGGEPAASSSAPEDLTDTLFRSNNKGDIVPMEKLKELAIRHALEVTEGNIQEAAQRLHIGRATFYRMLEKFKIEH
jgi:DNA-binding NtrC family response regulator